MKGGWTEMGAKGFVEILERFFLDIIGSILPGTLLIVGMWMVLNRPSVDFSQVAELTPGARVAALLGFGYVIGHGVTSAGHMVVRPIVEAIHRVLNKTKLLGRLSAHVVPQSELEEQIKNDPIFRSFVSRMTAVVPELKPADGETPSVRTWRSVAMSLVPDHDQFIYRMTFIAIFNLGVATTFLTVLAAWYVLWLIGKLGLSTGVIELNWWALALFISPTFFIERYYSFARRSNRVPFSMALVRLLFPQRSRRSSAAAKTTDKAVT